MPLLRQCNIRLNDALQKQNINSVRLGTESMLFFGPKIWNFILNDLKLSESLSISKRKSLKWVLFQCPSALSKINLQRVGFTERTPENSKQGMKLFLWVFFFIKVWTKVYVSASFFILIREIHLGKILPPVQGLSWHQLARCCYCQGYMMILL